MYQTQKKIDSLSLELIDSRIHTLTMIDSLCKENLKIEKLRDAYLQEIDSLKKENILLRSILADSVESSLLSPGYYYRKTESIEQNPAYEMEWIYVSESREIQVFHTGGNDSCLRKMKLKGSPERIYVRITRRHEKFEKNYLKCFDSLYVPSKVLFTDRIRLLIEQNSDDRIRDDLFFVESGVIRKVIASDNTILSYNYQFIGI